MSAIRPRVAYRLFAVNPRHSSLHFKRGWYDTRSKPKNARGYRVETIASYPDLISAQLAQSLLEAEGIDTSIPDENFAGIDWQWSTALNGIRLQVAPYDIESAMALLTD